MRTRPSEKYYRDTAKYYDLFAYRPDEQFFKEIAKRYGSPILELACGTGKISLLLAEEGYQTVGVDLSQEMLEIAREKLQQLSDDVQSRVALHRRDITNFNLERKFALVIIPSAFKFLLSTEDQLDCLKHVREHLLDDGVFVLDLYPGEVTDQQGTHITEPIELDGMKLVKTYKYSNDLNTQLRHWDVEISKTHPDGSEEQIKTQSTTSLIMPREADLLLKLAGFEIVEEYGGWEFGTYTPETWTRILVLKKQH
ncbi:MAG: class I SAM-dependent DNA methyltransferase [Candidatus Thorarchaeota archaeon]